jgi:hypothetical protein
MISLAFSENITNLNQKQSKVTQQKAASSRFLLTSLDFLPFFMLDFVSKERSTFTKNKKA